MPYCAMLFVFSVLQKCGIAPSPQDTRALFLEFDADGNNEISYDEFVSALRVSMILAPILVQLSCANMM